MGKNFARLFVFIGLSVLIVFFQNCELKKGGKDVSVTQNASGGHGTSYDGKLTIEAPKAAQPGTKQEIKVEGGTKPYTVTVEPSSIDLIEKSEGVYEVDIPKDFDQSSILIRAKDQSDQKAEARILVIGKNKFLYSISELHNLGRGRFVSFDRHKGALVTMNVKGQIEKEISIPGSEDQSVDLLVHNQRTVFTYMNNQLSRYSLDGELEAGPVSIGIKPLLTNRGILYMSSDRKDLKIIDLNLKGSQVLIDQSTGYEFGDEFWLLTKLTEVDDHKVIIDSVSYIERMTQSEVLNLVDLNLGLLVDDPRKDRAGFEYYGTVPGSDQHFYMTEKKLLPRYADDVPDNIIDEDDLVLKQTEPYRFFTFGENDQIAKTYEFEVPSFDGPKPSLRILAKTDFGFVARVKGHIAFYADKGQLIESWDSAGMGEREFDMPCDIAVNSKDEVHVVDSLNRRIQVYNTRGELVKSYSSDHHGVPFLGGHCSYDMSIDSKDRIYVVPGMDTRSSFLFYNDLDINKHRPTIIDPYGHDDTAAIREALQYFIYISSGIHVAGNGDIIIHRAHLKETKDSYFTSDRMVILNSDGSLKLTRNEGYMNPYGGYDIESKSNGNRVILSKVPLPCGEDYCKILEYDENWNQVAVYGKISLGDDGFPLVDPSAIAVDRDDNVYVTDVGNHNLSIFNSNGDFIQSVGAPGVGPGQFRSPQGVGVDSKGNIWVSDTGNNRLQKLPPLSEM